MSGQIYFDAVDHSYWNALGERKPSVTWILAESGLADFSFVEEEVRCRAMARGRDVHWMTRLEDEGVLEYRKVPLRLRPFRKGYLDWKRGTGFQPSMIEQPFISPFGYAGTLDRYGFLPPTQMYPRGSWAVIDLKTGSAQEWVKHQLAAYVIGINPNLNVARAIRRIALVLRADGTYQAKEFPHESFGVDFSVFIEAKRRVEERICQLVKQ